MINLRDLRAISEGYDADMVELCGGDRLLEEGATIQAAKILFGKEMRAINKKFLQALPYRKKDPKKAMEIYNEASDMLMDLKAKAKDIEDDTLGSHIAYILSVTLLTTVIAVGLGILLAMGMNPKTAVVPSGLLAGNAVLSELNHIGKLRIAIQQGLEKEYHDEEKKIKNKGYTRAQLNSHLDYLIQTTNQYRNQMKRQVKRNKSK